MMPVSVSLSVLWLRCANTAEWIELQCEMDTVGNKKTQDKGPDYPHGFNAASAKLLWPVV